LYRIARSYGPIVAEQAPDAQTRFALERTLGKPFVVEIELTWEEGDAVTPGKRYPPQPRNRDRRVSLRMDSTTRTTAERGVRRGQPGPPRTTEVESR